MLKIQFLYQNMRICVSITENFRVSVLPVRCAQCRLGLRMGLPHVRDSQKEKKITERGKHPEASGISSRTPSIPCVVSFMLLSSPV